MNTRSFETGKTQAQQEIDRTQYDASKRKFNRSGREWGDPLYLALGHTAFYVLENQGVDMELLRGRMSALLDFIIESIADNDSNPVLDLLEADFDKGARSIVQHQFGEV